CCVSIHKFSASKIFPVTTPPLENAVVITDENGKIQAIDAVENHDAASIQFFDGIIVPGFINSHCHLELSHLQGVAQTGTGLIGFITQVIQNRNHPQEVIQAAIEREEKNMIDNGIVAVGDISNTTDSFFQKQKEHLFYYTFVEYFDMFQKERTASIIEQYDSVFHKLTTTEKNKISKVPHAPYSVSEQLFSYLIEQQQAKTISIHNQETRAENELFLKKTGDFIAFYAQFDLQTTEIPNTNHASIYYALKFLHQKNKNLFVHNTLTVKEDIEAAHQQLGKENVFWATCPNANLYIENQLPNYRNFIETNAQVCIGTDSLTSNWKLNILEEMKTILKYQSYLSFEEVLTWATLNGAKALGFDAVLGSIEVHKMPGLVWIDNIENGMLTNQSSSKRII
ncbi:MAG TPA: amidohydrolase family protein, partial [Chitinophagales bacterium]|nr:amidohydrolase family protein [Chitinophagales bacterium]